ncbi:MAG: TIGR03618 family F420-dependent PPOX class oxidoreductase [Hyphomicrobiales bacterium]
MPKDQLAAFLAEPRIATLVTLRETGAPTAQPVWFEWDGREARVFTSRASGKVRRIQADPRVSLTVAEPVGVPEAWVTIEGTATIEASGGFELAQQLAPRYYSPEKAKRALEQWGKVADTWVVVRIAPARVLSSAPEAE